MIEPGCTVRVAVEVGGLYNYSTVYNKCTTNRTETDREYKQKSTTNATYEQRNTP